MNTLGKLVLLSSLSIFLFSASCSSPVKEPVFKELKESKIESMNMNEGILKIVLLYENPNAFALNMKDLYLQVYLDGNYFGIAEQKENVVLPASSTFDFPLRVHFNPVMAMGFIGNNLLSKKIKLKVVGNCKAGKGRLMIKVPIDAEEEIELRK